MKKFKPYNILFLEVGFAQGGSSNFLYHRLTLIDRSFFNPFIAFYYKNNGPDLQKLSKLNIPIFHLIAARPQYQRVDNLDRVAKIRLLNWISESFYILLKIIYDLETKASLILKVRSLIRQNHIHLVYLNNDIHYHTAGIVAAKICHVPCVCRKAGIGGGRFVYRLLLQMVDLVFAISKATEADALRYGIKMSKLIQIYEGISLTDYEIEHYKRKKEQIKQELGIPSNATVIGTISRLTPSKGQYELLLAAAKLLKFRNHIFFLLVGEDGDTHHRYRKFLENQSRVLAIDNYVKFVGWYDNIPKILSVIDIFVQNPNYPEGLGIANLEAMAMGKPTIVTKMGGLVETTIHHENGLVISANEAEELVLSLEFFLDHQEIADRMGKNGRKRIQTHFDLAKNSPLIDEMIINFLRKKTGKTNI